MSMSATGEMTAELREQRSQLIEQHGRVQKRLQDLSRLVALQLTAESPRVWDTLLAQKQCLLDQLAAVNLEALFLQTHWLIERLSVEKSADGADKLTQLRRYRDDNMALLQEIARLETAAEARLSQQVEELRLVLAKSRRNTQVNSAYTGKARVTATPRFLDNNC